MRKANYSPLSPGIRLDQASGLRILESARSRAATMGSISDRAKAAAADCRVWKSAVVATSSEIWLTQRSRAATALR